MYKESWIQHQRPVPVQSYESCLVQLEAKKVWLPCVKLPRPHTLRTHRGANRAGALQTFTGQTSYFQFSPLLTWKAIKLFNHAAPLDFENLIQQNGSSPDSKMSHFIEVVTLEKIYSLIYWHLSPNVNPWEKSFWAKWHHVMDPWVLQFGSYVQMASKGLV